MLIYFRILVLQSLYFFVFINMVQLYPYGCFTVYLYFLTGSNVAYVALLVYICITVIIGRINCYSCFRIVFLLLLYSFNYVLLNFWVTVFALDFISQMDSLVVVILILCIFALRLFCVAVFLHYFFILVHLFNTVFLHLFGIQSRFIITHAAILLFYCIAIFMY